MKDLPDESIDCVLTDPPYLYLKNQKLDRQFDEKAFFEQVKRVLKLNAFFDLSKENVSRMIIQLRAENNLNNRVATRAKIRGRVKVLHDERNDRLSCFPFRGKRFSDFTREEWVGRVSDMVEGELYSDKVSDGRAWATIDNMYKSIKLEFIKNATNQ